MSYRRFIYIALILLAIFSLPSCETEDKKETTPDATADITLNTDDSSSDTTDNPIKTDTPVILSERNVKTILPDKNDWDIKWLVNSDLYNKEGSFALPWLYMPMDGKMELSDAFVIECAIQAFYLSITTDAALHPVEDGAYIPIGSIQFMLDKQFENPPDIGDYPFGSRYRANEDYRDYIFLPAEYTKREYKTPLAGNYREISYDVETNRLKCKFYINYGDPDADCVRYYTLSPFKLNDGHNYYYRLIEITDEFLERPLDERVDVITDHRDWERLGVSYNDVRYQYIRAFIEGDTASLEHLTDSKEGFYDPYKTIVIGDYKIERLDTVYYYVHDRQGDNIILSFEILSVDSPLLDLSVGHHRYYIGNDYIPWYDFTDSKVWDRDSVYQTDSVLSSLMSTVISDLDASKKNYPYVTAYILRRMYSKENYYPTDAQIKAYAKKYFGIENFVPDYSMHHLGAYTLFRRILSEETKDGVVCTTVQFYADTARTIKSMRVEFYFQPLDGDFKPLYSVILEDTGLKTVLFTT